MTIEQFALDAFWGVFVAASYQFGRHRGYKACKTDNRKFLEAQDALEAKTFLNTPAYEYNASKEIAVNEKVPNNKNACPKCGHFEYHTMFGGTSDGCSHFTESEPTLAKDGFFRASYRRVWCPCDLSNRDIELNLQRGIVASAGTP